MHGNDRGRAAGAKAAALAMPWGLGGLLFESSARHSFVEQTRATDESLAARVQAGDTAAFGTLLERYEQKLKRYGRKFLARQEDIEDIVQDVFESAFRNIKSFDAARRFSPWIFRIAHNAFVNALRKNKLAPFLVFDFDTILAHSTEEAPADAEREHNEMRALIERGLERLDAMQREILVLFYLEDFSYQEIADILHVPMGTVGVRLSRAREQLRQVYALLDIIHD